MSKTGIIFDFDGLIANTEYLLHEVVSTYFDEKYDIEVTKKLYSQFVGLPDDVFFNYMKENFNLSYESQEAEKEVLDIFYSKAHTTTLMPGVKEFVIKAKENDLKLSIATSNDKENVEDFLERHDMISYFDFILGNGQVENLKPHPEVYLKSADMHDTPLDKLIVLEDSYTGYKAASASGIEVLMVLNEITQHITFGDTVRIVRSFEEIDLSQI